MDSARLNQRVSDIRHKHFIPLYQSLKAYIGLSAGFHISAKALKGVLQRIVNLETEVNDLAKEEK